MLRLMVLGLGLAVTIAGCGESKPPPSVEHVAFTEACTASGGEAAMCECRATKIDELLAAQEISPEVRDAFLLQEQGKEDEADAIMQTLSPGDLLHQPSAIATAQQECVTPPN